jgi:outer membrane protein OmpA-like peptidoglycan-associated protein/tetratricopeptide (TPR) repeat protein
MFIRTFLSSLLLLVSFCGFAQYENSDLTAARKKRDQGHFIEAASYYKSYLAAHPSANEVNEEFSEMLFFELRDYEQAYPYLKKVLTYEVDTIVYYYAVAKIEHYNGNYETADRMYKALVANVPSGKDTKWVIDDSKRGIECIAYCKANRDKIVSPELKVVNLGDHVNSAYEEYVPVVDEKEDFIMFTSRRRNQFNQFPDIEDDRYHEDMYMSKRHGHEFDTAAVLPYEYTEIKDVQNSKENESLVSISPDGKILFIYKQGTLWKSDYNAGKWTEPVRLEKQVISKDYANHVSMTEDGKTIFFSSEKKGSSGKLDIYKAEKKSDGTWTSAENVGTTINTGGNEQSPNISADGKTLYFSSDALPGYGGYDIYRSTFDGKKWSAPENLGLPFNSEADDVFFYPKRDNTEGFFSSNRRGGIGNFDIYRFYYLDKPDFGKQDLTVIDNKDTTLSTVRQATTKWIREQMNSDETAKMFFRVNDTLITSDYKKVESLVKAGVVRKLDIEQVKKCDTCVYKATNYYTVINPVAEEEVLVSNTTTPSNNTTSGNATVEEKNVVIYFDFNKSEITAASAQQLDEVVTWMSNAGVYKSVLIGYADPKGSDKYNKRLSERRAKAAAAYLKEKKIDKKRIQKIEGKGELESSLFCPDKACEEAENAKSRKVEIRLITK